MGKFNIATSDFVGVREVEAEPITIEGVKCFIQCERIYDEGDDYYEYCIISHFATGMKICSGVSRTLMIKRAALLITSSPDAFKKAKERLKKLRIPYPVNK